MLLQNSSFASFGSVDTLQADENTLREFIGRSSLPVVEQLTIHFLERYQWALNRTGTDAIRKTRIDCIFA
jgi:hypothetical protein